MHILRPGYGASNIAAIGGGVLQEDYTSADTMTWVTHSRTSPATMFDSAGKLTFAPNNLVTYGSAPANAAWTKTTMTPTTGVSDPDGGTNAFTLTATSNNAEFYQAVNFTGANLSGNTAVCAVYIKRKTGSGAIRLYKPSGSGFKNLNLTLTNDWQLLTGDTGLGSSSGGGKYYFFIMIDVSGDEVDVYMPIISKITHETATRAGDRVLTPTTAYHGPRMDYNPVGPAKRGLLREMARTNVVLYNRDLSNAAWTKSASMSAVQDQTGIDSVANSASSLTASDANQTCLQAITLASSARAQSAWVKRISGAGTIEMTMDNGSTWTAITVTGSWTKVEIPTQTLANPTVGFRIVTSGDAIAVDFVQNENGTTSTSSIHTTSAAVARAADTLTAALYTGDSVTEYYRLVSDLSQSSRAVNPFSGVSAESDSIWVEKFTKP